jgi:hypothetical protein
MTQEKSGSHKNLEIREGLNPESKHFEYFLLVSEGGKKGVTTANRESGL